MSEEEGKGFKVTDRRVMSEGEEAPQDEPTEVSDHPEAEVDETPAEGSVEEAAAQDEGEAGAGTGAEDPQITFATFVISLGDSALVHLGAIPNPVTGETTRDLRAARQTIDIVGLIEEKTRGNLSEEEEKLMTNLLYALRMQWIQGQGG